MLLTSMSNIVSPQHASLFTRVFRASLIFALSVDEWSEFVLNPEICCIMNRFVYLITVTVNIINSSFFKGF